MPVIPIAGGVLQALTVQPLLLLPMRLEYRVVEVAKPPKLINTALDRTAIAQTATLAAGESLQARKLRATAKRKVLSQSLAKPFQFVTQKVIATEIWFRWYPDEAFSEKGIAPATAEETASLANFRSAIGGKKWWEVADAAVSTGWQAFAKAVGPHRAIHLLRADPKTSDPSWEARIGRIAALPACVELFALTGSTLVSLGKGIDIPKNGAFERSAVSYTFEAVETGGWIADFSAAVEAGMGLKLTDKTTVVAALAANWIIAVGIHSEAAAGEMETLLRDRIANGEFEFLPQDAPTNNSAGERSIHMDPRYDLEAFMALAAQDETGALDAASGDTASSLLSEALAVDATVLRKAVRAADGAFEDARAMLRVVGPALLDDSVDGITAIEGVDENTFIEVMAASMAARGVLAPVRSGRNAYGIVTMTDVRTLASNVESEETERKIHDFLNRYASTVRTHAPAHADKVVPVLEPDDADASDKVEAILKTNRVSVRLDVADAGLDTTASIACPYVDGATADRQAGSYLKQLRTTALEKLVDPTSTDKTWPLLYRLARQTLTRNTLFQVLKPGITGKVTSVGILDRLTAAELTKADADSKAASKLSVSAFAELPAATMPKLSSQTTLTLKTLNSRFAAALRRLEAVAARENGTAELETLMMEVIDLFQHRVDAWATGLAFQRLRHNRQKGRKGLRAGYFGFLGKLRPKSATGGSDGYIQAPSMAQATSAAVMRSAYLRHRADGAFAINLRSRRARRAMAILDLLKKGISIGEALGMSGERWLHNQKLSRLTLGLRVSFPIKNLTPPGGGGAEPAGRRVFDGLAFLEGTAPGVAAADATHIEALKAVLADDLDALSDLVVAEAVHQRALGSAEAANAWLQVLSGEPVPGDPVFLRTQRSGQGSTYRVSMMTPEAGVPAGACPRNIAEPSFAKMAEDALGDLTKVCAAVTVSRVGDPTRQTTLSLSLKADLGMAPIDLVVGGASELELRIRHLVVERWLRDSKVSAALGSAEGAGLDAFIAREAQITVDLSQGIPNVTGLLAKAESLRRIGQHGRALEPADLNAAASPEHVLDEAVEIQLIADAVLDLRSRAKALGDRLASDTEKAAEAHRNFIHAAEVAAGTASGADLSAAETARRILMDRLWTVSAWAEPSAIRPFTLQEAMADLSVVDDRLVKIEARLATRLAGLSAALSATEIAAYTTLSDVRAARSALVSAIRGALDGEALPVLPRYKRVDALRPLLAAAAKPAVHLAVWSPVRSEVKNAVAAASLFAKVSAYPVHESATADDTGPDEADPRAETKAPRSKHFGVLLGEDASVRTSLTVGGLVADEWAEQRPGEIQMAAMAINYDSPQAESPHSLVLCVPPTDAIKSWTEKSAAEMVVETISWMKIRALATSDKLTPAALLPKANQVAYKKVGTKIEARIPQQKFSLIAKTWLDAEGAFVRSDGSLPVGLSAAGVNQRSGFFRLKE